MLIPTLNKHIKSSEIKTQNTGPSNTQCQKLHLRHRDFKTLLGTKYSRMDQVKFFKDCLPHISLGPFLNALSHLSLGSLTDVKIVLIELYTCEELVFVFRFCCFLHKF